MVGGQIGAQWIRAALFGIDPLDPAALGGVACALLLTATHDTSAIVIVNAVDLAADHELRIRDSVILSATAEAGFRLLPFASTRHALLDALLNHVDASEA